MLCSVHLCTDSTGHVHTLANSRAGPCPDSIPADGQRILALTRLQEGPAVLLRACRLSGAAAAGL